MRGYSSASHTLETWRWEPHRERRAFDTSSIGALGSFPFSHQHPVIPPSTSQHTHSHFLAKRMGGAHCRGFVLVSFSFQFQVRFHQEHGASLFRGAEEGGPCWHWTKLRNTWGNQCKTGWSLSGLLISWAALQSVWVYSSNVTIAVRRGLQNQGPTYSAFCIQQ